MTDQNDDGKRSNKRRNPDEAVGAGILGENGPFKQGAWSAEEDTILRDYVQKYGEGKWHLVHERSGLSRCNKSCRLRWHNHLRPDLNKSPFTPNEVQRIAELHAQMGNKWAKIAEQLPGRTNEEIKNYWNARIRRSKRGNMPLYPTVLDSQVMSGSQRCQNMATFQPLELRNLDLDQLASSFSPSQHDMPASSMVKQGISSPNSHDFAFPTLRPNKCLRESENMSAGLDGSVSSGPIEFGQLTDYDWERILEQIGLCNQYDSDLSSTYDHPETGVLQGGHVLLNDNTSSSELSSLQYSETRPDSWCMPSFPLPSFESVDTLFQSPPVEQIQSDWPINSGLLDSLLCEPNSDKSLQISFVQQDPEASISHTDAADRSFISPLQADPNTPLGPSASSLFSESTPPISGRSSSYDPGSDLQHEAVDQTSTQQPEEKGTSEQMDFSGPNVLPGPWPRNGESEAITQVLQVEMEPMHNAHHK